MITDTGRFDNGYRVLITVAGRSEKIIDFIRLLGKRKLLLITDSGRDRR